eukprot:6352815-Alexandrium_andersonii.AAC.1
MHDALHSGLPWYDRVPGPANVADAPSRLKFEELVSMGAVRDEPVTSQGWDWAVADEAGLASPF